MSGRKTLLYLGRDLPVPISGAARLRTYNWVLQLSQRFDVTFVAPVQASPDEEYVEALRPYCAALHTPSVLPRGRLRRLLARIAAEARYMAGGGPPEFVYLQHGAPRALLDDLGRRHRFDVVFAERWSWGERACELGTSAVLDAGGPQSPRIGTALRTSRNPLRRLLRAWLLRRTSQLEARVLARYGLVLTHSHVEERQVMELCADARAVSLPAGLNVHYFEPIRADVDPTNVVFYGALEGPAQRDALVHLQHDIMPIVRERLRDAALTVVDASPVAELRASLAAGEPVAFTGPIDDVRKPLRRAAVAAMPLRFGTGSRSRLTQLLALGVPVVATPHAARGLGLRSGDGVVIAADEREFARVLGDVLLDASLRDDLSQRGRSTAEAQFSIAATYELLSEQLAAGPEAP